MGKLLVILGPTATGKTDLALQLAKKFNGELVACDSRQVYIGLDIGTGKAPSEKFKVQSAKLKKDRGWWEINGVKVWMYDVVNLKTQYTVADYVKDANKVISGIVKRGKLPIIVGGTGLYLKALLEGLSNLAIPVDQDLRKRLEKLTVGELQQELRLLSPSKWKKLNESDRQNPRRLVRAIELEVSPRSSPYGHLRGGIVSYDILKIGLTAPREQLYKKVDLRILSRIDQGMISEAEKLHNDGLSFKRMRQLGLEYGVLADYLDGKIKTMDELVKIMQGKIHGYVRKQLTWFRKEQNIKWFDVSKKNFPDQVENEVTKWYDQA